MLKSLIIAFSTYSRIPMPKLEWDEAGMRYSLCFFPLVGAALGALSVICFFALDALGFGTPLRAAILGALPVLVTGGIHMDGFLDTVDAKSSWRPREEKLRILKDPHTGAFAVIYAGIFLLLQYGLFTEITEREIGFVAAGYVCSRIFSALSIAVFRKARKDGMAATAADAAPKRVKGILAAELAVVSVLLLWADVVRGGVVLLACAAVFLYYRRMSSREFGGITGDLAGYFLQVCELCVLAGSVFAGRFLG